MPLSTRQSVRARRLRTCALLLFACCLPAAGRTHAQTLESAASYFASVDAQGNGGLWYVPRCDATRACAALAVQTGTEKLAFVTALARDTATGELWAAEYRPHPKHSPKFQAVVHRLTVQRWTERRTAAPRVVREALVLDLFANATLQGLPIEGIQVVGARVWFLLGGSLLSMAKDGSSLRLEATLSASARRLAHLAGHFFALDEKGRLLSWELSSRKTRVLFQASAALCDVRAVSSGLLIATDVQGHVHQLQPQGKVLGSTSLPTGKLLRAAADPEKGLPVLGFQQSAAKRFELRVFAGSFAGPEIQGSYPRNITAILALPELATSLGTGCSGQLAASPALQLTGDPDAGNSHFGVLAALPGTASGALCLVGLRSDLAFGAVPLPLDLGGLGAPGCPLRVDPMLVLPMAPLGSAGPAASCFETKLPLPAHAASVSLAIQCLLVAPGANPGALLTSRGLRTTIL